jgi:S-layer homology domain
MKMLLYSLKSFFNSFRSCLFTGFLLVGVVGCISSPKQAAQTSTALSAPPATTPASPTLSSASPTVSATPVAFDDIAGTFAQKPITQLGQLGVFENSTGKFNPGNPITRAEFVRWLVKANNAIFAKVPERQIRVAESGDATFPDVPTTHPDFSYIQGMANSGIAIGYDEKTFKPDQPLTREEMISIKDGLDQGAVEGIHRDNASQFISKFSDSEEVSQRFRGSIARDITSMQSNKNINRTFGAIKVLKPKAPVTRAEAAIAMSVIGHDRVGPEAWDDKPSENRGTVEQALANR